MICVAKSCLNTPSLCTAQQMCNAMGMCVTLMTTNCTADAMCPAGNYCDTMAGVCKAGCRGAMDCPMGVCNASHSCQSGPGTLCGPCMQNTDCPAGTQCINSPLTGQKCHETCNAISGNGMCTMNPMAMCILFICSCL
jgi:hypothetical protein